MQMGHGEGCATLWEPDLEGDLAPTVAAVLAPMCAAVQTRSPRVAYFRRYLWGD
jgi:hypothetical protein